MTFLPIQFWTKFKKEEFGELDSSEILDLIQNYLNEQGFNFIERRKNKIVFHKLNGWSTFNFKSILVSGVITTKKKDGNLTVINGNWMILLLAMPFLFFIAVADSKFSTLDSIDLDLVWGAFYWVFGGNLVLRFFAHATFCETIETIIKENYTQQR